MIAPGARFAAIVAASAGRERGHHARQVLLEIDRGEELVAAARQANGGSAADDRQAAVRLLEADDRVTVAEALRARGDERLAPGRGERRDAREGDACPRLVIDDESERACRTRGSPASELARSAAADGATCTAGSANAADERAVRQTAAPSGAKARRTIERMRILRDPAQSGVPARLRSSTARTLSSPGLESTDDSGQPASIWHKVGQSRAGWRLGLQRSSKRLDAVQKRLYETRVASRWPNRAETSRKRRRHGRVWPCRPGNVNPARPETEQR